MMPNKRFLWYFYLLLIVIVCGSLQSCENIIDVSKYPEAKILKSSITIDTSKKISLSLIETGYTSSPAFFQYRGGSLFKTRKVSYVSILVHHTDGTFVIDTGLGTYIKQQTKEHFSWYEKIMFRYKRSISLLETLKNFMVDPESIDFIIPTHFHYDHVGGIEEFPTADVWISQESYQEAIIDKSFMVEQYDSDSINWVFLDFKDDSYEVFKKSIDVFKDGTVVLVPLPGHTEGSIGVFVNLASGKRFFFTGDLTFTTEGFEFPSEKQRIPRSIVDSNREKTKSSIVKVHQLMKLKPEIIIIPAHDAIAQESIAIFPEMER